MLILGENSKGCINDPLLHVDSGVILDRAMTPLPFYLCGDSRQWDLTSVRQ